MGFLIWLPVVSVVKALFILQTGWGEGVGRGRKQKKNHIYMSVLQMIKQRASRRRKQKTLMTF